MIWILIVTVITTAQGTLDPKIAIDPTFFKNEAACKARLNEITRNVAAAKASGEPVPSMVLGCRGIDVGVGA